MHDVHRRLGRIEKRLGLGEKDTVIIDCLGDGEAFEMDRAEFRKLLDEIDGGKGKLPCEKGIREGMSLCAGDMKR